MNGRKEFKESGKDLGVPGRHAIVGAKATTVFCSESAAINAAERARWVAEMAGMSGTKHTHIEIAKSFLKN